MDKSFLIKKIFINARIFQNPLCARILFTLGFHLSFSQCLSITDFYMSWACPLSAHGYGSVRPISQGPLSSFLSSSVRLRAQIVYWALGLSREHSNPRTNEWCGMGHVQNLMSEIRIGGWFEEECFLGQVKHGSNVYPKVQSNLPRNSSDRDVHLKCTKGLEAQKYLRESCYHRIKCSAANFLAALMWKRPLNSAALAIPIHREPEGVSDGTSTQVVAWMINK